MKAVVVPQPGGQLEIWDVPEPRIDDYQVLVEMLACGVCASTDSEVISGHFPGVSHYPTVLGHEGVGRVIEKGAKVRHFELGDLALRPGLEKVDEEDKIGSAWGAFAEFDVANDGRAMREDGHPGFTDYFLSQQVIPREMDPIQATLREAFKVVIAMKACLPSA